MGVVSYYILLLGHDSGEVDYRTLANQTAARVLEEAFHVSNIDLLSPSTFQLTGGWRYAYVHAWV